MNVAEVQTLRRSTIASVEASTAERSLVDLLGESRAAVVRYLKGVTDASVLELAGQLGISEVATRRHVDRLADDGLIASITVNTGRGRPVARWSLTDAALDLFPQRYDVMAGELLDFLSDAGRDQLGEFLRWRQDRQVDAYADKVDDAAAVGDRLVQLAEALSADGYRAEVQPDGDGFTLRQSHCTIEKVARDQPLVCGHEAAAFGRLLGEDVRVTRRETIAKGDGACVCHVQVRQSTAPTRTTLPVVANVSPTTSCCTPAATQTSTHDTTEDTP